MYFAQQKLFKILVSNVLCTSTGTNSQNGVCQNNFKLALADVKAANKAIHSSCVASHREVKCAFMPRLLLEENS